MEEEKNMDTNVTKEKEDVKKRIVNIDTIFMEDLGQFGLYQLRAVLLLTVAVIFVVWSSNEFIFTTARIRTRCLIPECENSEDSTSTEFSPPWLANAIPRVGEGFDNCQRFANSSVTLPDYEDVCPAQLFDQRTLVDCDQYVYENTNSVVYDFDLACDEWSRSLIGTIQSVGFFCALPMLGVISDRWGRRAGLTITSINTAIVGVLRYFANTYIGFVISQFFEAALGAGGYSCAYIIVNETCGPKARLIGSALMSSCFAIGQAMLGLVAWAVPDWRLLTLTVYIPQFIAVFYVWILPESPRWYLSKQRFDEAENILKNIARVNSKHLSEETLIALKENVKEEHKKQALEMQDQLNEPWLVVLVFQNKPILLRCLVVPVWWITMTFVYFGLTINSVNITGNSYLNFVAVSLVEVPGFMISCFLLYNIGRKPTLIIAFWICAACQFTYLFLPDNMYGLSLTVYLIGKAAAAMLVMAVYLYTTELYPTKYRHRLFAYSSMLGRIGSIVAPLTPAFGEQLPFILFGSLALVAGLLVFLTPETRGAKLADTMQDAVNTGRTQNDST